MGAISVDSASNRAVVNADECVECYTCFRGMSMEKLNPSLVRGIRRVQHGTIDESYVQQWAARLNCEGNWRTVTS